MASQAVSDIVRTTLGPRSMLKMLLDPMGGIGQLCFRPGRILSVWNSQTQMVRTCFEGRKGTAEALVLRIG